MKSQRINLLLVIILLLGNAGCKAFSEPSNRAIAFICKSHSNSWATFASQAGRVSARPIIIWQTKYFGDDYNPENRCQIVSDKLTNTVANNGGLQNLNLKSGGISVNNSQYIVICATTALQQKCNQQNMLFTLKPENAKNPNKVLRQMLNYTKGIDSNQAIDENNLPSFISLAGLVNNVSAPNFQQQIFLSAPLITSFLTGIFIGGAAMFWIGKRSVKAEVKRLQELVQAEESQRQTIEKQVKALEAEIETLKSQGASANKKIKGMQDMLQAGESQKQQELKLRQEAEAEAEVTRLQKLVQAKESQRQTIEKQVKALEAEIETLKSQKTAGRTKSTYSQKADSEEVELKSAQGVNYTRLRDLLAKLQFREADEETWRCMLKAAGQEEKNYLRNEDIDNFPCEDLHTIDRLWVKYSSERLGFSVQRQIYLQAGGSQQYNQQVWEIVSASFGWRNSGDIYPSLGTLGEQLKILSNLTPGWGWFSYSDLTFGKNTPFGHLPCGGCLRGGWDGWFMGGGEGFSRFMERLSTCQQHN